MQTSAERQVWGITLKYVGSLTNKNTVIIILKNVAKQASWGDQKVYVVQLYILADYLIVVIKVKT